MAFRRSVAILAVFALSVASLSTISGSADTLEVCEYSDSKNSCDRTLKKGDVLTIDCKTASHFHPGEFKSPTEMVCTEAMTPGKICEAASTKAFNSVVSRVEVSRTGNKVTVTAPSDLAAGFDKVVYGSCTVAEGDTKDMIFKMAFSSATDIFKSALSTALLVALSSTIYIYSR